MRYFCRAGRRTSPFSRQCDRWSGARSGSLPMSDGSTSVWLALGARCWSSATGWLSKTTMPSGDVFFVTPAWKGNYPQLAYERQMHERFKIKMKMLYIHHLEVFEQALCFNNECHLSVDKARHQQALSGCFKQTCLPKWPQRVWYDLLACSLLISLKDMLPEPLNVAGTSSELVSHSPVS